MHWFGFWKSSTVCAKCSNRKFMCSILICITSQTLDKTGTLMMNVICQQNSADISSGFNLISKQEGCIESKAMKITLLNYFPLSDSNY